MYQFTLAEDGNWLYAAVFIFFVVVSWIANQIKEYRLRQEALERKTQVADSGQAFEKTDQGQAEGARTGRTIATAEGDPRLAARRREQLRDLRRATQSTGPGNLTAGDRQRRDQARAEYELRRSQLTGSPQAQSSRTPLSPSPTARVMPKAQGPISVNLRPASAMTDVEIRPHRSVQLARILKKLDRHQLRDVILLKEILDEPVGQR